MHRQGELEALLEEQPEPPVPDRPGPREPRQPDSPPPDGQKPREEGRPRRRAHAQIPKAVRPFYEAAPGYANYWFNRYHQQRVWNAYLARGDFAETGWSWKISGQTSGRDVAIELTEKSGSVVMPDGKSGTEFGASLTEASSPPRSGGLLAALHLWQRLLLLGPRRFGEVYYLGTLPWSSDDELADCLVAIHGGVETKFYFNPANGDLVGIETQLSDDEDPCEVYFDDIRSVDGRALPHHWVIRHGDDVFADMSVTSYNWSHQPSETKD
jgi:hypothetical protein